MTRIRVIPAIMIDESRCVKTTKFTRPDYVGDPVNIVRIFNEKIADEIMILDISASRSSKHINFSLIEKIADECTGPLTYGGGIRCLDDAYKLFGFGIEKVTLQAAFFNNNDLIKALCNKFGSQSVAVSVNFRNDWLGRARLYNPVKKELVGYDIEEIVNRLAELGVGEVHVTSIDRDGTLLGPDFNLVREILPRISLPCVYGGGVKSMDDINKLAEYGLDGVSVGSFFIYKGLHKAVLLSYPKRG